MNVQIQVQRILHGPPIGVPKREMFIPDVRTVTRAAAATTNDDSKTKPTIIGF